MDNEQKQKFMNKLAIETFLSHADSQYLINYIDRNGNLDTAKEIYEKKGFDSLVSYKALISATVINTNWR